MASRLLSSILPPSKAKAKAKALGSEGGSHITDAPVLPRVDIGPAEAHLQKEMLYMYWAGVKRELPHILLTLRKWQTQDQYSQCLLPDEETQLTYGYDTFVDQVSQISRQFVDKIVHGKETSTRGSLYARAAEKQAWGFLAEMKTNRLKQEIRENLLSDRDESVTRRRARLLLQSAQFLDIDKMIEYREPDKRFSLSKRPAPPQLEVSFYEKTGLPVFTSQRCSDCHNMIRSSAFKSIHDDEVVLCESCYRDNYYGQSSYTKLHKTCPLTDAITPEISRNICNCTDIPHIYVNGQLRDLWPIDMDIDGKFHLHGGKGKATCGLWQLTDMVAEAKFAATRLQVDRNATLDDMQNDDIRKATKPTQRVLNKLLRSDQGRKAMNTVNVNDKATEAEYGSLSGLKTAAPESIPRYLRSETDDYPYGNVQMALRIGPIIIENGVANTDGGVVISGRDPQHLQAQSDSQTDIEHSLLLTSETERKLYSQTRGRTPKRYKAMMKQVVGGAFCGIFDNKLEDEIVDALLEESLQLLDEDANPSEVVAMLEQSTDRLMVRIKPYLSSRIEAYLASVVSRLLDPAVELRWNYKTNDCQTFCDSLIDHKVFGALVPSHDNSSQETETLSSPSPLYLMGFVSRPGAYTQEKAKSKFDVPNGLTEEYLLKFRYGRSDECDIIDTLAEYWTDWGGFEGPMNKYQHVFPWDCTEAFDRYPMECGECNVSKHVWAFPFDSWSMISLHLSRGRQLYPKDTSIPRAGGKHALVKASTGHMSDLDWFQNRMTVLLAQEALTLGAVAMAKSKAFRDTTQWLHTQSDETKDRLKLGGIHRAQPFSHHYDKGTYHQYFTADWASLRLDLRHAEYKKLRKGRQTREDVSLPKTLAYGSQPSNEETAACMKSGCGGFSCGALSGCAGGNDIRGGDTCGSGCVVSCGTRGGGGGCGNYGSRGSGRGGGGGGGGGGGCGGGCGGCGG